MRLLPAFLALVLPAVAFAAVEPERKPLPSYMMEQVKRRAVLADPACTDKKGDVAACYCVIDTVYPRFITASAAKPATPTTNAVPAEPENPNALPKAEELNEALKQFVDAGVEEGACPDNYSRKVSGKPRDFLTTAAIASTFDAGLTYDKGDWVGVTYRFFDRDGDDVALLYHRGLLLNIKTAEAVDVFELFGARQDKALNDEIIGQLHAKMKGVDAPVLEQPIKNGKCQGCLGFYFTPKGMIVQMLGIDKNDNPVAVDIPVPNRFIFEARHRALFEDDTKQAKPAKAK